MIGRQRFTDHRTTICIKKTIPVDRKSMHSQNRAVYTQISVHKTYVSSELWPFISGTTMIFIYLYIFDTFTNSMLSALVVFDSSAFSVHSLSVVEQGSHAAASVLSVRGCMYPSVDACLVQELSSRTSVLLMVGP